MTSGWPPSPSVEDEEAALAREHGLTLFTGPIQACEEPQVKGTVDQYPILLDVDSQQPSRRDSTAIESDKEHSSSDDSHGPSTPLAANREQRFVLLDQASKKATGDEYLARSRTTADVRSEDLPRGRPYVSPIHTNIGNDVEEMVTGQRRPPSPYSSAPKAPSSGSQPQKQFSGGSFLSPQHVSSDAYRQDTSTRPRPKPEDMSYLTDPDRSSEKRRNRSRRRRESGIRTERPSLEKLAAPAFDKRSMSYTAAAPAASMLSSGSHKQTRIELIDVDLMRQKPGSKDSPYSSSAEEKTRNRFKSRHRSKSRPRTQDKSTQGSPYTSSAEESGSRHYHRHRTSAAGGKLSRQGSTLKDDRPKLDIPDEHYSYGGGEYPALDYSKRRSDPRHHPVFDRRSYLEPPSAHSPQAVEEYLDKAFKANGLKRSSYTPRGSPSISPFASPARSPPRTPRGNRLSKDYFDIVSPVLQEAPSSRQPSGEDSPWSVLRPLNGVSAPAAGAAVPRAAPTLSRSSTVPIDTPSHGSSSKPSSSGQRSRKPSPVREDAMRPVSRAGSFDVRDERPVFRTSTMVPSEQRRAPRISSLAPEAPPNIEHIPTSRGSYVGLEAPHPITRAYSTTNEQASRPAPTYRAMSSSQVSSSPIVDRVRPSPTLKTSSSSFTSPTYTSSTYIIPTSASATSAFPFSTSRPASFTPVPVQGPPCPTPNRDPLKSLPACPRSTAVAGYHDWYTVNSVRDVHFCPTCMATLGSSRFRDIFVLGLANPNRAIACAMSRPWIRIAFLQAMKQRRTTQEMMTLVQKLSHLPDSTLPCPGKEFTTRNWYQLVDPFDNTIVPGFELCTHCVRNIDLVFPQLTGIFKRTTLLQERGCNLATQNKRFFGYIEQLDKAASRVDNEHLRKPDVQDLAKFARRVGNIRDCQRDSKYLSSEWHFRPDLPEFTVCGDCFEDVIRPVYEKPIAREFHKRARLLPTSRDGPAVLTSCQLYSDRMRKVFQDAVKNNDFEALKTAAVDRHKAETYCQARHRELMQDQNNDRTQDIRKNIEVWKSWE